MRVILGIDPGSRLTGFGVVRAAGGRMNYLASGCIRLSPAEPLATRLQKIYEGVSSIIEEHAPTELAIEEVFMSKSAGSALKLGQARGAAIVAVAVRGLSVFEYSPSSIKQAVVGTGRAEKTQVQHMVCTLLGLPAAPQARCARCGAVPCSYRREPPARAAGTRHTPLRRALAHDRESAGMIGRLRGILLEKRAPDVLVEANGVGYELQAPLGTVMRLPALGQEVLLHTHLSIREDAHQLFGFGSREERELFRSLVRVSGVGPKMALAILSGMDADEFVLCVQRNDASALVRIPGVGKKTAERLIVEMRDRLREWRPDLAAVRGVPAPDVAAAGRNRMLADAESALIALGYKPQEAARAISAAQADGVDTSEELIRRALKGMGAK